MKDAIFLCLYVTYMTYLFGISYVHILKPLFRRTVYLFVNQEMKKIREMLKIIISLNWNDLRYSNEEISSQKVFFHPKKTFLKLKNRLLKVTKIPIFYSKKNFLTLTQKIQFFGAKALLFYL